MKRNAAAWLAACGAVVVVAFVGSSGTVFFLAAAVPLVIAALGQDLILNRAGQASFGGAAMMAIGAFSVAETQNLRWLPFPLPLVVAGAAGGVIGAIIGLPGVRVRGLYLLLTTLALQAFVSYFTLQIQHDEIAGIFINAPSLAGLSIQPGRDMLLFGAAIAALVCVVLANFYRGSVGRSWQAIRENEVAARVMGLPTVRWKLIAFIVSSIVTSIGGALYAYTVGNVASSDFSLALAIQIVVMVYVGGRRTLSGPIIGALFVTFCPLIINDVQSSPSLPSSVSEWLTVNGANLADAIYAALLLLILVTDPDGIVGLAKSIGAGVRGRLRPPGRGRLHPPPLEVPVGSSAVPAATADGGLRQRNGHSDE